MSSGWLPSAARAIVHRPVLWLVLLMLALSPALVALGGVKPDNSLDAWFVAGDPALAQYHEFLREYGNDEAIIVGFDTPNGARSQDELALQRRIAERVERIDGIERVLVGSNMPSTLSSGLVARDESAAAIVAWVSVREDIEAVRGRIVDEVRRAASEELQSVQRVAHLAGNGVLYEGLNQQTVRDTGIFLSLALLAMVGLLGLALHSVRAVALVLIAPLIASAAGIGVLGLSGRPFTVVGSALPTLILVIALTDAIHVLLHYQQRRRDRPPATEEARRAQVADAVARMAIPCLYTSLTTAAGFLALATSRISLVRDFGLLAAAGMLLAWVITLVFMAATLSIFDIGTSPRSRLHGILQRACDALAARLSHWRLPVLLLSAAAALVLAAGIMRIESDTLTIGLLPERHVVRHDSEWLERRLGAYTPLEMRIAASDLDTAEAGGVAFAGRVREWRTRAEALPTIHRTFSAQDLGPAAPPQLLESYTSSDGRSIRVTAYVPMMSAKGLASTARALEEEGAQVFGREGAVQASGYLPLYARITEYVVTSTVTGLAVAFVIVFAMLALLIRSRGLFAAVPANLFPVLVIFGVMGWSGIPLDIATATVGAIVLGIAVDDTIHFLHHYRGEQLAGRSTRDAAASTIRGVGRSLMLTSIVLTSGFAVMIAAGTKAIAYFGLLAALAVASALFGDLFLLPALLASGNRSVQANTGGATR